MSEQARTYPPELLSPGLEDQAEDELRMCCRTMGCWRYGAPQVRSETRCRACGNRTVEWPLSDSPTT